MNKAGSPPLYQHVDLMVGESFLFEGDDVDISRLRDAVYRWGRNHGRRFTVRTLKKGGQLVECRREE